MCLQFRFMSIPLDFLCVSDPNDGTEVYKLKSIALNCHALHEVDAYLGLSPRSPDLYGLGGDPSEEAWAIHYRDVRDSWEQIVQHLSKSKLKTFRLKLEVYDLIDPREAINSVDSRQVISWDFSLRMISDMITHLSITQQESPCLELITTYLPRMKNLKSFSYVHSAKDGAKFTFRFHMRKSNPFGGLCNF